jgi:hypothetical protein
LIAIFNEPLSVLSRFLKIKSSCVKHLSKVYVTFESLNDFSSLIELSDGSLDSNFISLRYKISLVQQDHIGKFDLLTQQMEYLSCVVCVDVFEFIRRKILRVEKMIEVSTIDDSHTSVKLS